MDALIKLYPDQLDMHLAGAPNLAKRTPPGVTFHPLNMKSGREYFDEYKIPKPDHRAGVYHTCMSLVNVIPSLHAETPEMYIRAARSCEDSLIKLQPDLVTIDWIFNAARDAADRLEVPYIMLTPNTLKEVATPEQGMGVFLWPM